MVMENAVEKSCKLEKVESHKKRSGNKTTGAVIKSKRPKKQARPKKKILKRSLTKTERTVHKTADDDRPKDDEDGEEDDDDEEDDEDDQEQEELDVKKAIRPIPIETKIRRILQKELSLTEKMRLIKEHRDHKKSLRILAIEFNIGKSTVSGILKRRESIQKEHDATHNAADRCRKRRHTETELINDLVWKWYQITKSKDTPLSGPKIKAKARDYATDLGYDKFKASNGWLDTFKKTHGIRLPVLKIYGAVRELRNGGQRTRRTKPLEGKKRQRQVASVDMHNNNNNQWDTGTQNSPGSLHIPQIFEPEILLQTRPSQLHAHQHGYSLPQPLQQQQTQQQHHHHHHHHQHHHQQTQQQSLSVTEPPHPTVAQQVLTTQWANSSPDFQQQQAQPPPPPPPQQQQQQPQAQQQQAPLPSNGASTSSTASNNNTSGSSSSGGGVVVDNSPQQMMNNLSGMYNYAMSKNDHSLANQVLHLKAAFEASIIHDRFATTRRQSNNGSYFW